MKVLELDVIEAAAYACPEKLRGRAVVIIDVVRTSTMIVVALHNGCREVVPLLTVEETWERARQYPAGSCLTGGEREAKKIPGFDLDNSPRSYPPEVAAGRTVLLTTSNGTRALRKAEEASRVFIGGMVNASAVAKKLAELVDKEGEELAGITLFCAGTDDRLSLDDFCCAGKLVDLLGELRPGRLRLTDPAVAAREIYRAYRGRLLDLLVESEVYRTVKCLGLEEDLELCLKEDVYDLVPRREGDGLVG